jgi:hypothetical protein
MDVTLASSVDEFFHEVVTSALDEADVDASEPAGWYLVGLLGEFARSRVTDEPLGVKLARVCGGETDPGERVRQLKQVGDTSLYVAGYFAESLTRSLVDVEYYVGIGTSAYAQLARQLGGSIQEVYAELADKFPHFVDVLTTVRKRITIAELNGSSDISRLYEIWLRSRDAWVEKKLRDAGLLVDPGTKVIQ